MQVLDSNYRNYKMIERTLLQAKARLMGKLPDIQKAEEAVDLLIRKRGASEDVSKRMFLTTVLVQICKQTGVCWCCRLLLTLPSLTKHMQRLKCL